MEKGTRSLVSRGARVFVDSRGVLTPLLPACTGGAKMGNIDGHGKMVHNNIHAYSHVYGTTCFWNWPGWFPEPPYHEQCELPLPLPRRRSAHALTMSTELGLKFHTQTHFNTPLQTSTTRASLRTSRTTSPAPTPARSPTAPPSGLSPRTTLSWSTALLWSRSAARR